MLPLTIAKHVAPRPLLHLQEAEAALNSLDKASLGELKSFGSPAAEIVQVLAACMVLCCGGTIPKDLSWNAGKKFMGNVDAFLKSLVNFDKDNIPGGLRRCSRGVCAASGGGHALVPRSPQLASPLVPCSPSCAVACVDRVERDYVSSPTFRAESIRTKSSAAAGLCAWVINICKYFRIYQVGGGERAGCLGSAGRILHRRPLPFPALPQVVAPKRAALADANKRLETANKKLLGIRANVKELQDRVAALEDSLMRATEDKNAAVAQVSDVVGVPALQSTDKRH